MIEIKGKFNTAIIYNDNCEENAKAQVKALCDLEVYKDCKIRIMPDVHVGKFCPIGTTIELKDKVIPYTVGVDIGCGVTCVKFKAKNIDFNRLDKIIRTNVPSGKKLRSKMHHFQNKIALNELRCYKHIQPVKALYSLGTLGGGNHFIEVSKDYSNNYYLTIHTGSRHLGVEVAEYYQNKAKEYNRSLNLDTPFEFCWLEGKLYDDYIHDIKVVQNFAEINRKAIVNEICGSMKFNIIEEISINHNYIDDSNVLRKGAIASNLGKPVIIPVNMRDGVIAGYGKGNEDWNCSAPHGAGRIMAKNDVSQKHTVSEYKKLMNGIYCSVIGKGTLEEAPFAYRGIEELLSNIEDTIQVIDTLKPIYNYKAERKEK